MPCGVTADMGSAKPLVGAFSRENFTPLQLCAEPPELRLRAGRRLEAGLTALWREVTDTSI